MPVFPTRCRAFALALALPCLLSTAAAAQNQGDKDLKAISAYTLTMPKYKQFMTALLNLGKAAQRDSTVGGALEDSGNLTLDQSVARIEAVAAARKAIAQAGLTPREFTLAQGAMLQGGMAYGLMKQYHLTADSVVKATGVSRANLEFFRANEAELERMGKEMEAQMPKDQLTDEAGEAADTTE